MNKVAGIAFEDAFICVNILTGIITVIINSIINGTGWLYTFALMLSAIPLFVYVLQKLTDLTEE